MARKKRKPTEARYNRHVDLSVPVVTMLEDDFYNHIETVDKPLVLILDGIEDPHNLGACFRSADAAGVMAVVAPKRRAASITETVRRIAAGGAEDIPLVQVGNITRSMKMLRERGLKIVGTSDAAKISLYDADLSGPLAIVLGAEDHGIRRLTAETCDTLVSIPMSGSVECLNVSVATGICLFEAVRQRGG